MDADGRRLLSDARGEFPVLETSVYLNSNSTGAVPRGVREVLEAHWQTLTGWRDEVWNTWWQELAVHADAIASLLGAPPGSIVTDVSTASLLGRIATAFSYSGPRNRVVTTDLEFPTARFLWRAFARVGCELVVVPSAGGIAIDEDAVVRAIDERTAIVFVSHATFASGSLTDLDPIVRRAHEVGARVIVDAYASVGIVPVDVVALDVDVLVGGARKWLCGASDSAFMYVRPSLAETLEPLATGWMATEDPLTFEQGESFARSARRFASGTPGVLAAKVSQVGLDLVARIGVARVREA